MITNNNYQKLIYPINKMKITASINTNAYYKKFSFRHYGTDVVSLDSKKTVYASGNGEVLNLGYDNICGNVLIIRYDNVYNHNKKIYENIVIRYFHLESISVKINSVVNKNTVVGYYGKTGGYGGTGAHLHIEADLDTKYPLYTATVRSSNFLKGVSQGAYPYNSSKNTIRNVMDYLHCKDTKPDYQKLINTSSVYVNKSDLKLVLY